MVVKKKMGRPAGVKNKPTSQYFKQRAAKAAAKAAASFKEPAGFKEVHAEGQLHAEDEHVALNVEEQRLVQVIGLQRIIKSLEHQAIGYRAVISYLEHTISSSVDK
jgi:hypothetical protein